MDEFVPTTIEPSEKQAWITALGMETWISYPLLNGIPIKDFCIESMLLLFYNISSFANDNSSLTMST
jgi:hypothetical protein